MNGDLPPLPDLPELPDAGALPDLEGAPDLGTLPDLGSAPDLGAAPDLGSAPDLGGSPDFGAAPDLDAAPNLGAAPDLGASSNMESAPAPDFGGQAAPEAPVLERRDEQGGAKFKRSIYALPVTVDVVVGSARPTVTELLGLDEGSLLSLDRGIEDPVDLCVDGRVIARGELIEMEDGSGIGVRITQVVDVAADALG